MIVRARPGLFSPDQGGASPRVSRRAAATSSIAVLLAIASSASVQRTHAPNDRGLSSNLRRRQATVQAWPFAHSAASIRSSSSRVAGDGTFSECPATGRTDGVGALGSVEASSPVPLGPWAQVWRPWWGGNRALGAGPTASLSCARPVVGSGVPQVACAEVLCPLRTRPLRPRRPQVPRAPEGMDRGTAAGVRTLVTRAAASIRPERSAKWVNDTLNSRWHVSS